MGIPLEEMMARLPEDRRRRVEARTAELIAEEMSLRDLRKALGKTQAAVARKLGMKQENVSRFEQRADMLLSTLDAHLRALGGRLHLMVEFKGRAPVKLAGLAAIEAERKAPARHSGGRQATKLVAQVGKATTGGRSVRAPAAGRSPSARPGHRAAAAKR